MSILKLSCGNCSIPLSNFLCKEFRYSCLECDFDFCSTTCSKSHSEKIHLIPHVEVVTKINKKTQQLLDESNEFLNKRVKKDEEVLCCNKEDILDLAREEYSLQMDYDRKKLLKKLRKKQLVICNQKSKLQQCERCCMKCCNECFYDNKCFICNDMSKYMSWCVDCEETCYPILNAPFTFEEDERLAKSFKNGKPICSDCYKK